MGNVGMISRIGVLLSLAACSLRVSELDQRPGTMEPAEETQSTTLAGVVSLPPVETGRRALTKVSAGTPVETGCPDRTGEEGEIGCIPPPPGSSQPPETGFILGPEAGAQLGCREVTLAVGESATLATAVTGTPPSVTPLLNLATMTFSYVTGSPISTGAVTKQSLVVTGLSVVTPQRVIVTAELGWQVLGGTRRTAHCDHVVNVVPPLTAATPVPAPHGSLVCTAGATAIAPGASTTLSASGTALTTPVSFSFDAALLAGVGTVTSGPNGLQITAHSTVDPALPASRRTIAVTAVSRDAYGELRATCPAVLVQASALTPTALACNAAPTLGPTDVSYDFVVTASADATSVRFVSLTETPAPTVVGRAELVARGGNVFRLTYFAARARGDTEFRLRLEADGNTHATAECVGTKLGDTTIPEPGHVDPPVHASCFAPQPVIALPGGTGFAMTAFDGGAPGLRPSVSAVGPHEVTLLPASGGYLVKLAAPGAWSAGEQVSVTLTFGTATSTCLFLVGTDETGTIPPRLPSARCGQESLLLETQQSALLEYATPGQGAPPRISARARHLDGSPYVGAVGTFDIVAVGELTTLRYTAMPFLERDVVLDVTLAATAGDVACAVRVAKEVVFGIPDDGTTRGFVGNVWLLPPQTDPLPAEPPGDPVMTIVSPTLGFYDRSWTNGMAGADLPLSSVADPGSHCRVEGNRCHLIEWFMIRYRAVMLLPQTGRYCFKMQSDDGFRMNIDGALSHGYTPIHPPTWKQWCADLSAGAHDVVVDYMQGPRVRIALALEVQYPGATSFVPAPASMWARGLGL